MDTYGMYRDVPPSMSYPSGWRQRGYKIKPGEKPVARLIFELDGVKYNWPLYHLEQVIGLRGKKAKRRRQAYIAALYGHD